MEKLLITLIAYPSAPKDLFDKGTELIKNFVSSELFEFTSSNPDIIFVLSGGSEFNASKLINPEKCTLILGFNENNSFAAAVEIKAYCNQQGINALLINAYKEEIEEYFKLMYLYKNAIKKIKEYKLGLIGEVSEWLIASNVDSRLLKGL